MIPALLVLAWRRKTTLDVAKHSVRQRLLSIITTRPAATIADLSRLVSAKRGTVEYHLRILERAGVIQSFHDLYERRYLLSSRGDPSREQWARRIIALRTGRALPLVERVLQHPGVIQVEITKSLGMTRKSVRKYVNVLAREGLLEEKRTPHSSSYYPTRVLERLLAETHLLDRETEGLPRFKDTPRQLDSSKPDKPGFERRKDL